MDDVEVVVVAPDGVTAASLLDGLARIPGLRVEVVVRTLPTVVVAAAAGATGPWADRLRTLTQRELEVLQELVDGNTMRPGASHLLMSDNTFRSHVKRVLAKLGAHSSLEAASIGVSGGLRPRRGDRRDRGADHPAG